MTSQVIILCLISLAILLMVTGQKENYTSQVCCGVCVNGVNTCSYMTNIDDCIDSGGKVFRTDFPCKNKNACNYQCTYGSNFTY